MYWLRAFIAVIGNCFPIAGLCLPLFLPELVRWSERFIFMGAGFVVGLFIESLFLRLATIGIEWKKLND